MRPPVSAGTRVFAVLGHPVSHSLSPLMQGAALTARGLDAVYVALDCGPDELPGLLRGLARAGGGGNVTVPHKERAAGAVDDPTRAVERTGACNTFWVEEGRVRGDNTDVAGFRAALARVMPGGPADARILLRGAGGAARAALAALVDDGAGEILVWNRSVDRARRLVDRLGGGRARVVEAGMEPGDGPVDLLVQATSLGLASDDPLPVEPGLLGRVGAVLDLVYGPDATPLVRAARERGIPAADGREMLVGQGAAAFRRWFGDPVPVDAMRAALEAAGR